MAKSNYLAAAILNEALLGVNYAPPATVYLALFTVVPTAVAGSGTEVSGGSYARQAITFGAPALNGSSIEQAANTAGLTFPVATADWGTIVAVEVMDALAAGNGLYFNLLQGTNDVQTITITGGPASGSFTLTGNALTTVPIPYNATAAQVQAALEGIWGEDAVTCTGGPLPGTGVVAAFVGAKASTLIPALTHTDSLGGGTAPAVVVTHTTNGASGSKTILSGDQFTVGVGGISITES